MTRRCKICQFDLLLKKGLTTNRRSQAPYFLPFEGSCHTIEGRLLVERLANAFHKGLTFRIGKSLTSGRDNVVTWGSIPHKTTHGNGEYGYPDSKYLDQCNEELDALGVPMAEV